MKLLTNSHLSLNSCASCLVNLFIVPVCCRLIVSRIDSQRSIKKRFQYFVEYSMTIGTQWDPVVLTVGALGRCFLPFLLVYDVYRIRQRVDFPAHHTRPMFARALGFRRTRVKDSGFFNARSIAKCTSEVSSSPKPGSRISHHKAPLVMSASASGRTIRRWFIRSAGD